MNIAMISGLLAAGAAEAAQRVGGDVVAGPPRAAGAGGGGVIASLRGIRAGSMLTIDGGWTAR